MFAKKEKKLEIYSNFQFGCKILERYRSFFFRKTMVMAILPLKEHFFLMMSELRIYNF